MRVRWWSQAPADQALYRKDHPAERMPRPIHRKRRRAGGLKESPGVRALDSAVDAVGDACCPPTKDSCYGMEN